jgi:hypothetical protein
MDALYDSKLRSFCLGSSFLSKRIGDIIIRIFLSKLNIENTVSSSGERVMLFMRYIA